MRIIVAPQKCSQLYKSALENAVDVNEQLIKLREKRKTLKKMLLCKIFGLRK